MGQLFLTAQTGYAFSGATGGPVTAQIPQTRGSHEYVASDPDIDAISIASRYGIRSGLKLDRVANINVAPTIARLLAVKLPSAKGNPHPVLDEQAGRSAASH